MKLPIYMDSHATTPVDPRVLEAMLPYFSRQFGNAASQHHSFGQDAGDAVEKARRQVADIIGASPREIVFTSGATESNNLALKGVVEQYASKGDHVVTTRIEHRSVLDTTARLERFGVRVTYVSVGPDGIVDPDDVRRAMTDQTILISIMYANNEVGTIQPVSEVANLAHERGVLFHTDAVQAVGRIPVDVESGDIDLLSLTAHKIYGPKGVGALYVRRRGPRVRIAPMLDGGGHERGMRSGTLPVPLIVGFGQALKIAAAEMEPEGERLAQLRDRLKSLILNKLDNVAINGCEEQRLPNNLNLSIAGVDGEALITEMRDIAVSTGSACSTAKPEASHVLEALGLEEGRVRSSIRFGLGRFNTVEEIDYVAEKLTDTVRRLRNLSPLSTFAGPSSAPRSQPN